jgi:two-component system sensor histidine kinase MprB
VASADGVVVAASEGKWLGQTLHRWDLDDAAPIVVNDQQVGFLFLSLNRLGRPSMDVVGAALQGFLVAVLIIGGFSLLIGLLLSRGISRPLVELTTATRAMSAGDLSVRVPVRRHYHGEARELAVAFNRMAGQVEETIITLRRFISDAAHEIHTPLTALRTNLELSPDDEFVERAQAQVERLEMLTEGLLDLSRIEAGAPAEVRAPVALIPLVQEVSELYASQAEQAGLTFDLTLPETPVTVQGDEAQLQRALGNLLDNAIKFTPAGGTVSVGLCQEGEWAELWVEDTGIGIPEDDLPHLFSRFHRGRNAAAYPGSGLGLAIVKAIVEGHGGRVRGENVERGARFTVWLPRCP